ncbi:MAG: helix-turn-helix transcriptional regulator [Candidatus Omnitrophota bacterium]
MGEPERKFGSVVKKLREAKGFTQESFAYHIGIDRSYQGRIERGEASVTLHKIGLIAKSLGLAKSELFKKIEDNES